MWQGLQTWDGSDGEAQKGIELLSNKLMQKIRMKRIRRGLHKAFQKKGEKNEDEDVDFFDSLVFSFYIFPCFFSYVTYYDKFLEFYFNKTVIILSIIWLCAWQDNKFLFLT